MTKDIPPKSYAMLSTGYSHNQHLLGCNHSIKYCIFLDHFRGRINVSTNAPSQLKCEINIIATTYQIQLMCRIGLWHLCFDCRATGKNTLQCLYRIRKSAFTAFLCIQSIVLRLCLCRTGSFFNIKIISPFAVMYSIVGYSVS